MWSLYWGQYTDVYASMEDISKYSHNNYDYIGKDEERWTSTIYLTSIDSGVIPR